MDAEQMKQMQDILAQQSQPQPQMAPQGGEEMVPPMEGMEPQMGMEPQPQMGMEEPQGYPQFPQEDVDNPLVPETPDPTEMLPEVIMEYMDYTIGIKNDKTLDKQVQSQIMVQMAQALNYLVPLVTNDQQQDMEMKQVELQMKYQEHQMAAEMKQQEMEMKKQEHEMKLQFQQEQNQMKLQQEHEKHQHSLVQSQQSHESKMNQDKQAAQLKSSQKQGS